MLQDKTETAFSVLMAGFVMVLVLTNIIGVKLFLAFSRVIAQRIVWRADHAYHRHTHLSDHLSFH